MESFPNEIIGLVLQHARPIDIWTFRECSRRMRIIAEEAFLRLHLRSQVVKTDIGLGIYRRGGPGVILTFKFQGLNNSDPEYANLQLISMALKEPHEEINIADWPDRARDYWNDFYDVYGHSDRGSKIEKVLRIEIGDQDFYARLRVEKISADQGSALCIRWKQMYAFIFAKIRILDSITKATSARR